MGLRDGGLVRGGVAVGVNGNLLELGRKGSRLYDTQGNGKFNVIDI